MTTLAIGAGAPHPVRRWRTEFERVLAFRAAARRPVPAVCLTYWGAAGAAPARIVLAHGAAIYAGLFGPAAGMRARIDADRDD